MGKKQKFKELLKAITPSTARKAARIVLSTAGTILQIPGTTISLFGQSQNLRKRYPSIQSAEILASKHIPMLIGTSKTLDLGCGSNPRNPFGALETFGVDIRSGLGGGIKQADLATEAIPFSNDFFDFCTAFDVIEHIPRNSWKNGTCRLAFLEVLNEIHRVLKPGGLFLHSTPAFPSKEAFQDPTHVNIITEDTMPNYFCEPHSLAKHLGYGFNGSFELVEQRWVSNTWIVGIMRVIK
jgi:SAM-dependent methyltransferase